MRTGVIEVLLAAAAMAFAVGWGALAAEAKAVPNINMGRQTTSTITALEPVPNWLERDTLTGEWGGSRTWLKEHGITLEPRLTQFYQGMTSGDGDEGFHYGGKADLLLNADLSEFGCWDGFSLTVHAEYNFGRRVNGRGGTMLPVNTALQFPGIDGADAFDLSSVYLGKRFGNSVSLIFGKINIIDAAASKPFMGGAGIDSFWNIAFTAPPSGTVPPYLLGALLSVRTKSANYILWVFDPISVVNRSGLDDPFSEGVTVRGGVEIPVTMGGRSGHQGFTVSYSTRDGTDQESLDDIYLPSMSGGAIDYKDYRYYFAYSFDQYLYQSEANPEEGLGLFGQIGVSDGNPNRLDWGCLVGVGGTGLIPGRSRDNWGVGFNHYSVSNDVKRALAPMTVRDEEGLEVFYNAAMSSWVVVGADLQVIDPALGTGKKAVFFGLRTMIKF